jgi:nucleoside-diphosphate-sugar epimerase
MNCFIGFTGLVGSTLMRSMSFDFTYNSKNIQEIDNKEFDTVFCAGVSAQKWLANKDPDTDIKNIQSLIDHLKTIKCKKFILISTVDVFSNPYNVDENSIVDETNLDPYGKHRRYLEKFVEESFDDYLIIRLPGLFGQGLKKNIIFDLHNNKDCTHVNNNAVFQFYNLSNLSNDIKISYYNIKILR